MTENHVYLQPAYILQQRPYRENSLLLDVLTRDFGKLPILAKGVRTAKSKTAALLQVFVPLCLSYLDKHELKIMTTVEIMPPAPHLTGIAWYCGFYINELTELLLHSHDPHPEVFAAYQTCLHALSAEIVEPALRRFECELLSNLGYGLQLDYEADTGQAINISKQYALNDDMGFIQTDNGLFSGASLVAIARQQFTHPPVLNEAKALMRIIIDKQLNGRTLKSRGVINQIIKKL